MLDGIRLLRGRCALRRHPDVETRIILPDIDQTIWRKTRIHEGTVVKLGPPPCTRRGVEVPWFVEIGQRVLFVYAVALERFRQFPEDIVLVHVDELQAVVE